MADASGYDPARARIGRTRNLSTRDTGQQWTDLDAPIASLQEDRGGGTIEVGAPASGIRRALPMP